jgi:hypothetical protein
VSDAGLLPALEEGPLTLFAPSDEVLGSILDNLTDEQMATVLAYHLVEGRVPLENNLSVVTLNGSTLTIKVNEEGSFVEGEEFVGGKRIIDEIPGSDGIVYVIDGVLTPDRAPRPTEPAPTPPTPAPLPTTPLPTLPLSPSKCTIIVGVACGTSSGQACSEASSGTQTLTFTYNIRSTGSGTANLEYVESTFTIPGSFSYVGRRDFTPPVLVPSNFRYTTTLEVPDVPVVEGQTMTVDTLVFGADDAGVPCTSGTNQADFTF